MQATRYRLALEDMEHEHWIAWALDLPGCYSAATTRAAAVAQSAERIVAYYTWRAEHDCSYPTPSTPIETEVVETFQSFASSENAADVVNAFFADDRRPLTRSDITTALQVLQWTRQDLRAVIEAIPPERRSHPPARPAGRATPADLLRHIAHAENWYFSQLGLALPAEQLSSDPPALLETVRANTRQQLPKLAGDDRITSDHGEQWSARKILRRTLWHERDHTQHIARLL